METSWHQDGPDFVLKKEDHSLGRVHWSQGGWLWSIGSRCGWSDDLERCQRFVEQALGLAPAVDPRGIRITA
ncbi:MAG TPA: hypothetical protein ENK18_03085 [Deltaproteobacteria bacterium]|nr:hypothetical protein [Deltaproteobacteria bacterium]